MITNITSNGINTKFNSRDKIRIKIDVSLIQTYDAFLFKVYSPGEMWTCDLVTGAIFQNNSSYSITKHPNGTLRSINPHSIWRKGFAQFIKHWLCFEKSSININFPSLQEALEIHKVIAMIQKS